MATYYLSNAGSDAANGTSTSTPWVTIDRLNTALATGSIGGGDSILFRRGDTFYGSPDHSGHFSYPNTQWLTYGAYGTGAKPKISCYKVATEAGWESLGGDIWRINIAAGSGAYTGATAVAETNVGHLRVNGVIYGQKRETQGALTGAWDFFSGGYFSGTASNYLYVRSVGNPSSNGRVVEINPGRGIFNVQRHRTIIEDLEIVGGEAGIEGNSYWAPHDVIVRRCDIHALGGGYLLGYGSPTRGGNGVQAWIGNKDWLIERNRIWDIYDVAVTYQGGQGVQVASNRSFERLHARRNTIWNCGQSLEVWSQGTDGEGLIDCTFTDNFCFDAGGGWGHAVRPDPAGRGCHVLLYEQQLPLDLTIERNVFFGAATNYLFALNGIPAGLTLRDNAVYLAPGTRIQDSTISANKRSETITQAAAWTAATGQESGTVWFSDRSVAEAHLAGLARSGKLIATASGMRAIPAAAVTWPSVADPLGAGLPQKFYTDFSQGFLPDVFEPLGGGKPYNTGGNAYLQPDGSANPYNFEMQWMRPSNVRIRTSQYSGAEGNVLALITRRDGYTTTLAANRTDATFDYLVAHPNPQAGRDGAGNPKFPYTGGMVTTQQDKLTPGGKALAVSGSKDWIASARMRWTQANGYWPAFWMYPDDSSHTWLSEYDIMEDFSPRVFGVGKVVANMFKNGTQLPYNDHKVRSLDLTQFHTWVVRHELAGSAVTPGAKRLRVYVDGTVFFDSDFYRNLGQLDDTWFYSGTMHFLFQGAQIGGSGSNGSLIEGQDGWRDLDRAGQEALPLTLEVSQFGVWETGATPVTVEPTEGHPVLGDVDVEPTPWTLPTIPTSTAIDSFAGSDGAAWSSTTWDIVADSGQSAGRVVTQQGGKGRLTTGASAYSSKASARTKQSFTGGTVRYDVTITNRSTDYTITLGAMAQAQALENYLYWPWNGYLVSLLPATGQTLLRKTVGQAATTLATLAGTSGTSYALNDVVHVEITRTASNVEARIWKNADARPSAATLTAADTTYTAGMVQVGIQAGAAAGTFDVDNISWTA